ncbi:MAG: endonuclease/exonuclease/phosphatase family protein [Fimbriimonadaceae bacterium]|nr:endonuclease/exonuclease/phosphatase family protein [Fimbriimonadaceae bacterium]
MWIAFLALGSIAMMPTAPATSTLTVMTFNVHHGEGVDGRLDLPRIAGVILAAKPDLVALQELDVNVGRSDRTDQPAELARLTGMRAAFGKAIDLDGGAYGVGVLSRFPLVSEQNRPLPGSPEREARTSLHVVVEVPGTGRVRFVSTHFDHKSRDDRAHQAKTLAGWVEDDVPTLVAGDLNDVANGSSVRPLFRRFLDVGAQGGPTYPAHRPDVRIDFVLARPTDAWTVVETRVPEEPVASDHRPLVVVLRRRSI